MRILHSPIQRSYLNALNTIPHSDEVERVHLSAVVRQAQVFREIKCIVCIFDIVRAFWSCPPFKRLVSRPGGLVERWTLASHTSKRNFL